MTAPLPTTNGLILPPSVYREAMIEVSRERARGDLLEASIADLRWQLDERRWQRLDGTAGQEFSRHNLDVIVEDARAYYLKNPLIRRPVDVGALYVWGQDLSRKTDEADVEIVLDRFWDINQGTLTGQQSSRLLDVELQVTGNVFLAFFVDQLSGDVRVRQVPVEGVREIITNPEDGAEVWYYLRQWNETPIQGGSAVTKVALHPEIAYRPPTLLPSVQRGGQEIPVRWEAPVHHLRTGAFLHWRWGVPEVYPALDWAKAYKEQLEDDAARSRSLTRWAYTVSTEGGAAGVTSLKAKLGTSLGTDSWLGIDTNPPPVAGAAAVLGGSTKLDPIRLAGAQLDPDHSRPARLMVASAIGLPDTILSGDVDQGTLATAKSLDRPTELKYSERRNLWLDFYRVVADVVIDASIRSTRGTLHGRKLTEDQRKVVFSFPDLLERSVGERVDAVVAAATLGGSQDAGTLPSETVSRLLMAALEVTDIDSELKALHDEQAARDAKAADIAKQQAQTPPPPTTATGPTGPSGPTASGMTGATATEAAGA